MSAPSAAAIPLPSREDVFLDNHRQALGRVLGIEFDEVSTERVTAWIDLERHHLTPAQAVQGGVVMAIADVAGALGAIVNLAPGHFTTTIESKSNFLKKGAGNRLVAESTPIHVGRTTSVWRTKIFRGADQATLQQIAEVTQTQLILPDASRDAEIAISDSETLPIEQVEVPDCSSDDEVVVSLADTRKQQILAGACKVMMRKGYAKASVREIAEACGMPIPTMYKYVRSKEDILFLIYENFLSAFNDRLHSSTQQERPPEQQFNLALEATIGVFDEYHEHVKLLFRETKSLNSDGRRQVYALDQAYIKKWTSLISALGADRRMGIDAELLANFVYYLTTVWPMRHWAIGKWGLETVSAALGHFVAAALAGSGQTSRIAKPAPALAEKARAGARSRNRN